MRHPEEELCEQIIKLVGYSVRARNSSSGTLEFKTE